MNERPRTIHNGSEGVQGAHDQLPLRDGPLATTEGEKRGARRFLVSVVSKRVRLVDPDNLCPKYIIDCLRYAGVLPDDSPEFVTTSFSQIKVARFDQEETLIEVTRI